VRGSADSTFSEGRRTTSNFNLEISVRLSKQLGCYTAIPNLLAELFKYNNSVAERQQTWRRKGNIDIACCPDSKQPRTALWQESFSRHLSVILSIILAQQIQRTRFQLADSRLKRHR
jgi:hypothetical protein